jgi:hypothetical protein
MAEPWLIVMKHYSLKEIENIEKELKLDSIEIIEESIRYYIKLYNNEEYLRQKIEKQANILIAGSAIIITIVTGFFSIILYNLENITSSFLVLILIIYLYFVKYIYKLVTHSIKCIKLKRITAKKLIHDKYNITNDVILKIKKFKAIIFIYFIVTIKI